MMGTYLACMHLQRIVVIAAAIATLLLQPACTEVSGTGRSQFNILSVDDELDLGQQAYVEELDAAKQAGHRVLTGGAEHDRVMQVSQRIFDAANRMHPEIARRFNWEMTVIDDPETVNAWALPGGKSAVFTGLLPVTKTDAQLAVVIGHEAAHAIARHGGERMSQEAALNVLMSAGFELSEADAGTQEVVMNALGLGTLAFSRSQESEADHLGLLIAADAGFDPREAIPLWQNMAAAGGEAPPEFLSTHPSESTRIQRLNELMPEAMAVWQAAKAAGR
ncbi:MAG: M48 family metallopeptidase [Phycisphaerae bacterium]|nr:M48 family metallopeptidase [Phycisphaerae bacterium]